MLNRFDPDDDLHRRNAAWLHDLGIAAVLSAGAVADLLDGPQPEAARQGVLPDRRVHAVRSRPGARCR